MEYISGKPQRIKALFNESERPSWGSRIFTYRLRSRNQSRLPMLIMVSYCREDDDNNYYYFGINNDGEFSLWLYKDAQWTQLIENTTSTAFARGEANKVSMIAEGDHFIFFVNDVFAAEFFDCTLTSGATGLAIEISEPGLHATFEFDNLIVNLKK